MSFMLSVAITCKYAIYLLQKPLRQQIRKHKPGPKPCYQLEAFTKALMRLWFDSYQACSKRLKALIPYSYRIMKNTMVF